LADLKDVYAERCTWYMCVTRSTESSCSTAGSTARGSSRIIDTILPVKSVDEWFLCGPYALVVGAQELH